MARNREIKLKLDKEEKEKLQKKADEIGLKLSQYIRMTSLHAVVIVNKNN